MTIPDQKRKLNQFVRENKESLTALALALQSEWGETKDCLGIDLLPKPHFVRCSREAIETLNQKVDSKIQEILGILDGYKRSEEIAIMAIGRPEIDLIHYKIEGEPLDSPDNLDSLIQLLETRMQELFV
jgi:hypothetical protein